MLFYVLCSCSSPQLWATRRKVRREAPAPSRGAAGEAVLWVFQPIGGAVGLWEVPRCRWMEGAMWAGPSSALLKKKKATKKKKHRTASKNGLWNNQPNDGVSGRVTSIITPPQHGAPCGHYR